MVTIVSRRFRKRLTARKKTFPRHSFHSLRNLSKLLLRLLKVAFSLLKIPCTFQFLLQKDEEALAVYFHRPLGILPPLPISCSVPAASSQTNHTPTRTHHHISYVSTISHTICCSDITKSYHHTQLQPSPKLHDEQHHLF